MKRLVVLAVACLFVLLPTLVIAAPADSASAAAGRPNSLEEGKWAILFTIDSGFNTGGVFFKKHLGDNHAVRLGAEFSVNTRSGDISSDTSSVVYESGSQERDQVGVHVELIAQRYARVTGSAHVFYGIGPFFDYREYHDEWDVAWADDREFRSYDEEYYSVGGLFLVGGEWFASKALSLDIEYLVSFGYNSSSRENVNQSYDNGGPPRPTQTRNDELSGWFIDAGNAVRFGLGIYF
jgi:hypothetical protein